MTDHADTFTQALPAAGGGNGMGHVALAAIAASLTNPRKHFDPAKLQELADSIKETGVHQPILLRPLPEHRLKDEMAWAKAEKREVARYEVVAGERRYRASKMAGLVEIPAMIRELTDVQALEIQIIENLQREDVSELEEAEGFQALMEQSKLNADQVGEKIGQSRSYVYARLKILDLCQEGREALRQGKIDFSKGLLIARIPDESLQLKALQYCSHTTYQGDARGYRDCAQHVQSNYMLKLSAAVFKITDASLVPGAGSCKECPKRTGATPDLFTDVSSADVCTDPKCFRAKEEAHHSAVKTTALERGQHIIDGREAKTLMPSFYSGEVKGYLRLDDKDDSPTGKPLRKLVGKVMEARGILPTLVANPHKEGVLVAVITPEQAEELLKEANQAEAAVEVQKDIAREEESAQREASSKKKTEYETQWRWDLLVESWKTITEVGGSSPTDSILRHMATTIAKGYSQDRAKKLCKLLDLGKVAPVAGLLQFIADTHAPGDVLQLLVMYGDVEYHSWREDGGPNTGLLLVAQDWSVDVAAVKAKAKANQRAAEAAAARKAQATAEAVAGDLPLKPAARAGGDGQKGGAKKPRAARAEVVAKTTPAEASASIAAALQAADSATGEDAAPGAAAAAQGNDAPAVADAPPAASAAPGGNDSADVSNSQPAEGQAEPLPLAIGVRVVVLPTATGKKQRPKIGEEGKVVAKLGDTAWDVEFPAAPRCKAQRCAFDQTELEVLA